MDIRIDNLEGKDIAEFLQQHINDMRSVSPPESKHALDLEGLRAPDITFWSLYDGDQLVGCAALKELDVDHGEVKSMRVKASVRGQGIGSKLVSHVVQEAMNRQYRSIALETGSMPFFEPARALYLKHGFSYCGPFGSYKEDPYSVFMELRLGAAGVN
ncbi:GNAT family N-acetyltransferase [Salinispirillum marinum]|uniref:GNAT family N-acetyltransferase n=2 Tax=Saccharospirillaceae TaxID=255527 RepID=A0ABV8BE15_9GAMM